MAWVIIYGDLSTASCEDMNWAEAPSWDVQIVLFRDPALGGMWTIRHGAEPDSEPADFFRLDHDGSVVGMDTAGFIGHVTQDLKMAPPDAPLETMIKLAVFDTGAIKAGKMLSTARWMEVLRFGMELRNKLRAQDGST